MGALGRDTKDTKGSDPFVSYFNCFLMNCAIFFPNLSDASPIKFV